MRATAIVPLGDDCGLTVAPAWPPRRRRLEEQEETATPGQRAFPAPEAPGESPPGRIDLCVIDLPSRSLGEADGDGRKYVYSRAEQDLPRRSPGEMDREGRRIVPSRAGAEQELTGTVPPEGGRRNTDCCP